MNTTGSNQKLDAKTTTQRIYWKWKDIQSMGSPGQQTLGIQPN